MTGRAQHPDEPWTYTRSSPMMIRFSPPPSNGSLHFEKTVTDTGGMRTGREEQDG